MLPSCVRWNRGREGRSIIFEWGWVGLTYWAVTVCICSCWSLWYLTASRHIGIWGCILNFSLFGFCTVWDLLLRNLICLIDLSLSGSFLHWILIFSIYLFSAQTVWVLFYIYVHAPVPPSLPFHFPLNVYMPTSGVFTSAESNVWHSKFSMWWEWMNEVTNETQFVLLGVFCFISVNGW